MHFRHLPLFSLVLAATYSFAQPAPLPPPSGAQPTAAPSTPAFAGENPFDRKPTTSSAPSPTVASPAASAQGMPGRSGNTYPQHQSAPIGFPYPNGQGGGYPAAGPIGIGQSPGFEVAPPIAWDEQVQAQRIGKVNKEHIFRGVGTYVFETKSKVKVTRNPAQSASGLPAPLAIPGGVPTGSVPQGLPSMVGRPGAGSSMFTSPAQPASSSAPRPAGK